jgi:hypothetical protein
MVPPATSGQVYASFRWPAQLGGSEVSVVGELAVGVEQLILQCTGTTRASSSGPVAVHMVTWMQSAVYFLGSAPAGVPMGSASHNCSLCPIDMVRVAMYAGLAHIPQNAWADARQLQQCQDA